MRCVWKRVRGLTSDGVLVVRACREGGIPAPEDLPQAYLDVADKDMERVNGMARGICRTCAKVWTCEDHKIAREEGTEVAGCRDYLWTRTGNL
jgi:hypothetical protein